MEIYKGNLKLIKTTDKMVVYGNESLRAQYIPKEMLEKCVGKRYPDLIVFTLELPTARVTKPRRSVSKGLSDV